MRGAAWAVALLVAVGSGGVEARRRPRTAKPAESAAPVAARAQTAAAAPRVEVRVVRFGEQSRVILDGATFRIEEVGRTLTGALPGPLRMSLVEAARASLRSGGVGRSCAVDEPWLAVTLADETVVSGLCTTRDEIAPWRALFALLQQLPPLAVATGEAAK